MNENFAIQLFEGKKVRIVWDAEQEKYYFSVTDIVQVLTDSVNPRDYIKKMLRRDPELKSKWGTICPPVEMLAPDGDARRKPPILKVFLESSRPYPPRKPNL